VSETASLITRTEREIYLEYERQRRVQMLRIIAPAFALFCGIVLLVIAAVLLMLPMPPQPQAALLMTAALLSGCVLGLGAGLVALWRNWLSLATAFVAGTSALGVAGSLAIWGRYSGLDPFAMLELTPFSVVIILAGVLGNIWWILGATVVMNGATVALLLLAPRAAGLDPIFARELPLIVPVALVHQWLFAALMIMIWVLFRRTLGAVGTAYERAKQLDQLKDEFIASVNHELRTPLMTMQTYIETLREHSADLPPEQVAAALDQVGRVGDSLVELVKDILSTRQIDQEGATFVPQVVGVRSTLETAAELVDPREAGMVARDLRLAVGEQIVIWGDRLRLQQILTNLLSNAVKYSAPGTPIEVSAQVTGDHTRATGRPARGAHTRDWVEIVVRDYGLGIPPDQVALLFNRFVRLPRDLASNVTGTGLGLYLCRVLAEAMGGRIWVESSGVAGEGSSFHLLLPVPTHQQMRATSSRPLRVLEAVH
jgi:signal transduction histidine kinase